MIVGQTFFETVNQYLVPILSSVNDSMLISCIMHQSFVTTAPLRDLPLPTWKGGG